MKIYSEGRTEEGREGKAAMLLGKEGKGGSICSPEKREGRGRDGKGRKRTR